MAIVVLTCRAEETCRSEEKSSRKVKLFETVASHRKTNQRSIAGSLLCVLTTFQPSHCEQNASEKILETFYIRLAVRWPMIVTVSNVGSENEKKMEYE